MLSTLIDISAKVDKPKSTPTVDTTSKAPTPTAVPKEPLPPPVPEPEVPSVPQTEGSEVSSSSDLGHSSRTGKNGSETDEDMVLVDRPVQ